MSLATSIVLWVFTALVAAGIFWSRYDKKKTQDKRVRELAAMDPARREQLLSRLNPKLAREIREQLMQRFPL